jgi:hypothetical protein
LFFTFSQNYFFTNLVENWKTLPLWVLPLRKLVIDYHKENSFNAIWNTQQ